MKVANFGVDHAVAVVRGRVSGVAATGTSTISEIGLISIDATISADTDDWNPTGLATASIIRATATATWNLTGITAPAQDVLLILNNVGSNAITLVNDATSTAGNRFLLPGGTDLSLGADNGLWLVYDGTTNRWRVIGGTGGGSGGGGDLSQERFVASGGTPETFTLAATPVTVICFVNGVEQDPDDVGVSGADVSVNTTASDIVVIVYSVASGGGSGAMTQIYDLTLGSDTASFDVTSIAGSYSHLHLRLTCRSTRSGNTEDALTMRFNNDSGSNYDYQDSQTYATSYGTPEEGIATSSFAKVGNMPAADSPSGNAGQQVIDINDYAGTTFHKLFTTHSGAALTASSSGMRDWSSAGHWRSTSAITRITLAPANGNFLTGSRLTIYGIT